MGVDGQGRKGVQAVLGKVYLDWVWGPEGAGLRGVGEELKETCGSALEQMCVWTQ